MFWVIIVIVWRIFIFLYNHLNCEMKELQKQLEYSIKWSLIRHDNCVLDLVNLNHKKNDHTFRMVIKHRAKQ